LQKQEQLLGIKLLALGSKEPPHQRIDLLPQQLDLLLGARQFLAGLLKLLVTEREPFLCLSTSLLE
jgi:hypothetical protein